MPMPDCYRHRSYQNLFLTVPDRGFSKDDLLRFLRAWRKDYKYIGIAREPYSKPKAGWTHHYHVGICFHSQVRIGRLWDAANKSKLFTGMAFHQPLVAKGKTAEWIFDNYFTNPSKYKALDQHPMLVRDIPPCPPKPGQLHRTRVDPRVSGGLRYVATKEQWNDWYKRACAYYTWAGHTP